MSGIPDNLGRHGGAILYGDTPTAWKLHHCRQHLAGALYSSHALRFPPYQDTMPDSERITQALVACGAIAAYRDFLHCVQGTYYWDNTAEARRVQYAVDHYSRLEHRHRAYAGRLLFGEGYRG